MSGYGLIVGLTVVVIVFALSQSVIICFYCFLLSKIGGGKQSIKSLFSPLLLLSSLLILIIFIVDRNTQLSWTPMFKLSCWIGLNTASLVHYYKKIQDHNNPPTQSLDQIGNDWKKVIELHTQNSIIFGNESENLPS